MLINILLGFVIPWLFGFYLYMKDKAAVFNTFPIGAALAFTVNQFGFYFGFWDLTPILRDKTMSALPLNLGLFPLLGCYLIHLIRTTKLSPALLILLFTLGITFLEWLGIVFGKVIYGNGWNIGWTFVTYGVIFIVEYAYFTAIRGLTRTWG